MYTRVSQLRVHKTEYFALISLSLRAQSCPFHETRDKPLNNHINTYLTGMKNVCIFVLGPMSPYLPQTKRKFWRFVIQLCRMKYGGQPTLQILQLSAFSVLAFITLFYVVHKPRFILMTKTSDRNIQCTSEISDSVDHLCKCKHLSRVYISIEDHGYELCDERVAL